MEEKYLYQLAEFVLPSDVLHYFSIVKIESDTSLLRIYLDEKMEKELSDDLHFESKGFMEAVEVTDFPIRDHKVILVLRRRRWIDIRTGKSFSLPLQIDITASGTRYSKEFGTFLKETYGDIPVTCRTLEEFYHINGRSFEKQYKETLSGYRSWNQLSHAQKWLLFEDNIGKNIAIDETSLSNGELYTIITNRDKHGKQGCLVAIVAGTKSLDVCKVLDKIDEKKWEAVEEVTLDLSDGMRKIVRHCFPKAKRVIDRFHIQKLASDAVQQMRIEYRWAALQQANDEKENAKLEKIAYQPLTFENGDTRSELLVRSRYLLFKSSEKWTDEQKLRAKILFREYPDIKKAYGLSHSLRMIFAKNTIKDAARLSLAKWYNNVAEAGFHSFNVIAATFYEHYEDILNFYINRSTNAAAESFNAKIKLFRANLRGVVDKSFFLFRLAKIYAYPH